MAAGIVESAGQERDREQRERESQQQGQRSRLVQRLLAASPNLPAFLNDLITVQAVVVAGTEAAAFVINRGQQSGYILEVAGHVRPDGADEATKQEALNAFKELVIPSVQQGRDAAIEIQEADGTGEAQFCLVTILRNENQPIAVSAVIARARSQELAQQRLMSMQLVAGYFDLYMLRRKSEQAQQLAQNHQDVLQLSTAVGTAENFAQSAANLCNTLATRTGAVRVSLGWLRHVNIKVKALSHTENWDKRQELIQQIQNVMEEAADQDEPVYFNPTPEIGEPSTQNVTREAAAYSRSQGGNSVLSVPLRKHGELVGVITLEWAAKTALPAGAVQSLAVAADVLSPQLWDRHENDRWLITKAGISTRELGKKIIGPKYMVSKLVCTALLIAVIVLFAYHPMYHVTSRFEFATTEKRVISAPYDGFLGPLATVDGQRVREGTPVHAGQELISMETGERETERVSAESEERLYNAMATQAQAEGKQADAQQARAKADGARARKDLKALEIAKSKVVAPIDGIVSKSDAEDRTGGQVKAGETLFEIAQVDKLRVQLDVSERDVQRLKVGQTGELATKSRPGEKHKFTVDRIVPQGTAKDGSNIFTVYGTLTDTPKESWLPGIEGEARIDIQKEPLYYHWTHKLVDWVRLKLWI